VDPLFHPFAATCGTPDPKELKRIVQEITDNHLKWLNEYQDPFGKLDVDVLACNNPCRKTSGNNTPAPSPIPNATPTPSPCEPLHCQEEKVSAWGSPTPTPRPSSPIKWDGKFSYASSATEAFLLEYANGMNPGWGQVDVGQKGPHPKLSDLLRLHEFYFKITERDWYLARIQGANLLREIHDQLNRQAGGPVDGECPRGDGDTRFVGLVGHDTNLANLNELLNVTWKFDGSQLPDDTRNLPENDALPAGALVFELHGDNPKNYRVRIQYVTQSLCEIRNAPLPGDAYRLLTSCGVAEQCEMSLAKFNQIAEEIINKYRGFLSHCNENKQQICLTP
jgi:hypothetical protein